MSLHVEAELSPALVLETATNVQKVQQLLREARTILAFAQSTDSQLIEFPVPEEPAKPVDIQPSDTITSDTQQDIQTEPVPKPVKIRQIKEPGTEFRPAKPEVTETPQPKKATTRKRQSRSEGPVPNLYEDAPAPLTERYVTVDSLGRYLKEIRHDILTAEEERVLSQRVQAGLQAIRRLENADEQLSDEAVMELEAIKADGLKAKHDFIQANLRLVVSIARKYYRPNGHMELLDIIQEGNAVLEHAVEKFDWRKGFKFSTYGTWWIKQAIGRALSTDSRSIRLPVGVVDIIQHIEKMDAAGEDDASIADALGIPKEKVYEYRQIMRMQPASLDMSLDSDTKSVSTLGDLLPDPESSEGYEAVEDTLTQANTYAVLKDILGELDGYIVAARLGLSGNEPKKLDKIGLEVKLTRERVRQRQAEAMVRLRHPAAYTRIVKILPQAALLDEWKADGKCSGKPLENFFNTFGVRGRPPKDRMKTSVNEAGQKALEICEDCPVKEQCTEEAKSLQVKGGVWGGTIYTQRNPAR